MADPPKLLASPRSAASLRALRADHRAADPPHRRRRARLSRLRDPVRQHRRRGALLRECRLRQRPALGLGRRHPRIRLRDLPCARPVHAARGRADHRFSHRRNRHPSLGKRLQLGSARHRVSFVLGDCCVSLPDPRRRPLVARRHDRTRDLIAAIFGEGVHGDPSHISRRGRRGARRRHRARPRAGLSEPSDPHHRAARGRRHGRHSGAQPSRRSSPKPATPPWWRTAPAARA